jgi:hypothetical protein
MGRSVSAALSQLRLLPNVLRYRLGLVDTWRTDPQSLSVASSLMWDELATMHRGAGDYRPDERRVMLRTIVYAS